MLLVGMIQSEEGGFTNGELANFWQWPVLRKEPVRVDEDGDLIFEVPESA